MIRPDFAKWHQSPDDVRRLSLEAEHPRSRERFQALYLIGSQQTNASQWARQTQRQKQTVLGWVHRYNEFGPESIFYQHSGGRLVTPGRSRLGAQFRPPAAQPAQLVWGV